MRHRTLFIVVVWSVVSLLLGFPCPATAQVTVQQPVKKPEQTLQLEVKKDTGVVAALGGFKVVVLDVAGDGLDLGGRATVNVAGSVREVGWTRPKSDDAFLMVSAASIRQLGFELTWASGGRIQGQVLVSDGLSVTSPDGTTREVGNPLDLLQRFDTTRDGRLDEDDSTWRYLFLVVDTNGDGRLSSREINSWTDSKVGSIALSAGGSKKDAHGNRIAEGAFVSTEGKDHTMAVATLRKY